jgi:hypothetical protein
MTMSSQLWRAVLDGSSLSADQQDAAPDEEGSYGALVEAIDEIVSSPKRSQSRKRKPTPRERAKRLSNRSG